MTRDASTELVAEILSRWSFFSQNDFRIASQISSDESINALHRVTNVDKPSKAIEVTLSNAKKSADQGSTTLVITSSRYEAQILIARAKSQIGEEFALDLTDKISLKEMATLGSRRRLLIATPEILHRKILPDAYRFSRLLEAVGSVELHDLSNFRGVLGSHLYYILKRLSIAKSSQPLEFRATSIYLGNARSIFAAIIGAAIDETCELWQIDGLEIPCLTASVEAANATSSPSFLAASIAVQVERLGLRVTVLTSSRNQAEVVAETISSVSSHNGETEVKPLLYRGGYIDEVRDDIRDEIASGDFKVAVATSQLSLELPQSDVVIFLGIPKTIAQIRRNVATLSKDNSVLILLPDSDNLDQWVVRNINAINSRLDESAAINPQNPKVMEYQILCAADESTIRPEQLSNTTAHKDQIVKVLETNRLEHRLVESPSGYLFVGTHRPSKVGGLRGGDSVTYTLITDDGELLEVFDSSRLFFNFYLGAIHRHRGRRFRITDIDFDQRLVYCT